MQLLTTLDERIFVATQSSSSSSSSEVTSVSAAAGFNGSIFVINTNNNTVHELNFNDTTSNTNTSTATTTATTNTNTTATGNNSHHIKQINQLNNNDINYIYCSNNGRYIVASLTNKHLYCWEYNNTTNIYQYISYTILKKRPTSIVYSTINGYGLDSTKDILLVSDKAGDVWSIDLPCLTKQVLVSGHCASVITDMAIYQLPSSSEALSSSSVVASSSSSSSLSLNTSTLLKTHNENITSLVATSDRDEKIRITCFPNMVTIMAYCLGHTNVVTSISFFHINQKLFLISSGWDHCYIIWDPITGLILDKISTVSSLSSSTVVVDDNVNGNNNDHDDLIKDNDKNDDTDNNVNAAADNDEDDDENKQYNEEVAGHYPLKIRVNTSPCPMAAVLFRRLPTIKLHIINDDGKFGESYDLQLPYVPVDVSFIQGQQDTTTSNSSNIYLGHLVVLLPQPECLHIYELYKDSNGMIQSIQSKSLSSLLNIFKNDCILKNIQFEQVTGFGDENAGMNRDTLDRPFRKEVIDISNRKHNKRAAKKRKLEEDEIEANAAALVSNSSSINVEGHDDDEKKK